MLNERVSAHFPHYKNDYEISALNVPMWIELGGKAKTHEKARLDNEREKLSFK
jgi:hypothetical protein